MPISSPVNNAAVGRLGEAIAASFLINQGYSIVARNLRYPVGEIDILASPPQPNQPLSIVEVKTRRGSTFGMGESVTPRKMHRLRQAAAYWLREQSAYQEVQFDVLTVLITPQAHKALAQWGLADPALWAEAQRQRVVVEHYLGVDRGAC